MRKGHALRMSLVPVTVHLLGAGSSGACPVQARGPVAAKQQDPSACVGSFIHLTNTFEYSLCRPVKAKCSPTGSITFKSIKLHISK